MPEWTEEDEGLVINTLSQNANGMFRWVACHIDGVLRCYPDDIRSTLADLPKDLDETYGRTLLDIDDQKRKYTRRLLQCLSVSIRPLRVEELADIFAVPFDATSPRSFNEASRPRNAEWAVLSACSCLITTVGQGESQVVQFSHSSVKEFLTSERLANAEGHLSFYHILPEPAHTTLAHASLSVLLQLDDKIDRDIIGRFPLAPYAARHWVDHAQYSNVSSHVQELMEHLFDPKKSHFAAWVWLYDIDRYWLEPMLTVHPTRPEAGPLYYASLCGFHRLVERLVSARSSDVKSRGGSHTTPLHAASVMGHLEVASLLIENSADPNSRDSLDRVPLHLVSGQLVIAHSSLEIARLLVNSGAYVDFIDYFGSTPLHTAAVYGCRNIAELLLESGATLDVRNKYQETQLHVACKSGKFDVSHFLIDRGSDINARGGNGFTPLHKASRHGHVDIAQLLLDRGSDVNTIHQAKRWTPLHYASRFGYLDVSRLLVNRGADVNAHNAYGSTPMHFASGKGHLDIVKLLVDQGANVDSRNDKEETPLHRGAGNGFLDVMRFLIESGATVSTRDEKGWTPFHKASFSGHIQVVRFLLGCGVDVDIRNGNGRHRCTWHLGVGSSM
ncbi:Ankyrin repeat-containing domain protein [Russula decolorans]